jgi:hypothetical protein
VTAATASIAAELDADAVRVLAAGHSLSADARLTTSRIEDALHAIDQPLAGDPDADGAQRAAVLALGFRSRLSLPVTDGGIHVGTPQAFATTERPWTRFEIRRARVIALALGATLTRTGAVDTELTVTADRTALNRLAAP